MSQHGTYHALNRLLTILYRSLPMYVSGACPWTRQSDDKALAVLRNVVADQKQLAERIAQAVLRIGPVDIGEFPVDFPDMNDLSLDFLLTKMVQCQKNDVAAIERCMAEAKGDRQAAALAEEALGAARGHLESLEELAGQRAKSP